MSREATRRLFNAKMQASLARLERRARKQAEAKKAAWDEEQANTQRYNNMLTAANIGKDFREGIIRRNLGLEFGGPGDADEFGRRQKYEYRDRPKLKEFMPTWEDPLAPVKAAGKSAWQFFFDTTKETEEYKKYKAKDIIEKIESGTDVFTPEQIEQARINLDANPDEFRRNFEEGNYDALVMTKEQLADQALARNQATAELDKLIAEEAKPEVPIATEEDFFVEGQDTVPPEPPTVLQYSPEQITQLDENAKRFIYEEFRASQESADVHPEKILEYGQWLEKVQSGDKDIQQLWEDEQVRGLPQKIENLRKKLSNTTDSNEKFKLREELEVLKRKESVVHKERGYPEGDWRRNLLSDEEYEAQEILRGGDTTSTSGGLEVVTESTLKDTAHAGREDWKLKALKELETTSGVTPEVATDPELEKALQTMEDMFDPDTGEIKKKINLFPKEGVTSSEMIASAGSLTDVAIPQEPGFLDKAGDIAGKAVKGAGTALSAAQTVQPFLDEGATEEQKVMAGVGGVQKVATPLAKKKAAETIGKKFYETGAGRIAGGAGAVLGGYSMLTQGKAAGESWEEGDYDEAILHGMGSVAGGLQAAGGAMVASGIGAPLGVLLGSVGTAASLISGTGLLIEGLFEKNEPEEKRKYRPKMYLDSIRNYQPSRRRQSRR